jgi:hypothetical protein
LPLDLGLLGQADGFASVVRAKALMQGIDI